MDLPETMSVDAAGNLVIGGMTAKKLADRFGTPLYVYDEELIRKRCRQYNEALSAWYPRSSVAYAAKAFFTAAMATLMNQEGLGLDVVSGGEIYTALKASFPPSLIGFNGNNKSDGELVMAVKAGIGRVIVDGLEELEALDRISREAGVTQGILLRITPGVEAHTHHYIQTGKEDSKFGFTLVEDRAMQAVKKALASPNLCLKGIHCHIGSQVFDLTPFGLAASIMMDFRAKVLWETGVLLPEVNMGGGLGVPYVDTDSPPKIEEYVKTLAGSIKESCRRHSMPLPFLHLEPGRSLVAEAGITLYRVGTIKDIPGIRTYISVDGGMTDNPRPALYDARYKAILAERAKEDHYARYALAGRCCESGDMLIRDVQLPEVRRGDLVAVFSTGAYNYSMASNYNRLPRLAAVLVSKGRADVIVERESYEDIVIRDRIPARLLSGEAQHIQA